MGVSQPASVRSTPRSAWSASGIRSISWWRRRRSAGSGRSGRARAPPGPRSDEPAWARSRTAVIMCRVVWKMTALVSRVENLRIFSCSWGRWRRSSRGAEPAPVREPVVGLDLVCSPRWSVRRSCGSDRKRSSCTVLISGRPRAMPSRSCYAASTSTTGAAASLRRSCPRRRTSRARIGAERRVHIFKIRVTAPFSPVGSTRCGARRPRPGSPSSGRAGRRSSHAARASRQFPPARLPDAAAA